MRVQGVGIKGGKPSARSDFPQRGTVLKHAIGMSEETFYNIARWSMLVLLIAINIPPVRQLLGVIMALVSWPFAGLFSAIAG